MTNLWQRLYDAAGAKKTVSIFTDIGIKTYLPFGAADEKIKLTKSEDYDPYLPGPETTPLAYAFQHFAQDLELLKQGIQKGAFVLESDDGYIYGQSAYLDWGGLGRHSLDEKRKKMIRDAVKPRKEASIILPACFKCFSIQLVVTFAVCQRNIPLLEVLTSLPEVATLIQSNTLVPISRQVSWDPNTNHHCTTTVKPTKHTRFEILPMALIPYTISTIGDSLQGVKRDQMEALKVLQILIDAGANVNLQRCPTKGWTGLHWAIEKKADPIVTYLLTKNADLLAKCKKPLWKIKVKTPDPVTPLALWIQHHGSEKIAALLT